MELPATISIGQLGERSGVAASALRFYEERGLLQSSRSGGGQRRYSRSALRRVAFVRAAQQVGLSLGEIKSALGELPDGRTPTRADWAGLSRRWQASLEERIVLLEKLRDELSGCIGCGWL